MTTQILENTLNDIFVQKKLKSDLVLGKRVDSRKFTDYRKVRLNNNILKNSSSSAIVNLGDSTFIAACNPRLIRPDLSSPRSGEIQIVFAGNPGSFKRPGGWLVTGGVNDYFCTKNAFIAHRLNHLILINKIIDIDKLCVSPGKLAWSIQVELLCYNDNGNSFDCALLAVYNALKNLQIPHVVVEQKAERLDRMEDDSELFDFGEFLVSLDRERVMSLEVRECFPFSVAVVGGHLVVDPNKEEENALDSLVNVVLGEGGQLLGLYSNGAACSWEILKQVLDMAKKAYSK